MRLTIGGSVSERLFQRWSNIDHIALGHRLQLIREDRGLTQRELAWVLRVPPQTVSGWENGFFQMSLRDARKCARALRCSFPAFLAVDAAIPRAPPVWSRLRQRIAAAAQLAEQSSNNLKTPFPAQTFPETPPAPVQTAKNENALPELMPAAPEVSPKPGTFTKRPA